MDVRGVDLQGDQGKEGNRRHQQSGRDGQPGPEPIDDTRAEWTGEGEGHGQRQEPKSGLHGTEPVHALQVERDEEEHAEQGEEIQQQDDRADGDGSNPEDA